MALSLCHSRFSLLKKTNQIIDQYTPIRFDHFVTPSSIHISSEIGCYKHSPEELGYCQFQQTKAISDRPEWKLDKD
jgi:hypothetical protein